MDQKLLQFFRGYKKTSYARGQHIDIPHDRVNELFLITQGHVRIYSISNDGEELTMHIARSGSCFPLMFALPDIKNTYSYEALDAVEVYHAPKENVLLFLKNNPDALFNIATRFAAGICGLMTRIENIFFLPIHPQTASLLLYLSKENDTLPFPMTHSDMASWLGVNRETVSRHLKRMEKKGLITTHGKKMIMIKDVKTLQSIAKYIP